MESAKLDASNGKNACILLQYKEIKVASSVFELMQLDVTILNGFFSAYTGP